MNIDNNLKDYINKNILPLYDNNHIGDEVDRVEYVIKRSQDIIKENNLDVDDNILYTVISFHDIRVNNDEKDHELVSADIMYNDEFLKSFFTDEDRLIIKEAIEDQRAKTDKEPRNIYGKILSSASRNSSVDQCLKRTYYYGKKLNPDATDEELFKRAYEVLKNKFGEGGYAKFYFHDEDYENFLKDIRELLKDKDKFIKIQKEYITKLKERESVIK